MDPLSKSTLARQEKVPFLEYPSLHRHDPNRKQCLIYFIPGNPGLIGYYIPFFKTLRQLLDEAEDKDGCQHAFHIYGRQLLGFDDADHSPPFGTPIPNPEGTTQKTEPFTLEDQILASCAHVQHIATTLLSSARPFDEVILTGHSVGAYISLEIFNRHHHPSPNQPHTQTLSTIPLKAGILLFPAVSHIAQSSSGQKLDLIRRTPLLDRSVHHLARGLVALVPDWALGTVLRRVMRFPEHAAAATLRFITSRDGIWQALHMGKDEMRTITEERDEFIEKRRRHEKGRTKVVIDEAGIPHAFCIHHSEAVSEKVKTWIEDIAGL